MPLDHYVTLGRSGLRVSPFALGAMTFGEDPGAAGCSVEESEKILATYLDLGGNFIDTANFFANGHSEKSLGDWFAAHPGRRDRVVLASKFFGNLFPGDPNGGEANLAGLDVSLAPEHLRTLDEVSTPALGYPAPMHGAQRAMLQFAGTTVDDEPSTIYPPPLQSDVRY
jgi:aryl-alcohol dehydrogenase-like predicted oxidoreductase